MTSAGLNEPENILPAWLQRGGYRTAPVLPDEGGICRPGLELEHYDLDGDPRQLNNLAPALQGSVESNRESELRDELRNLGDCAGIQGRDSAPANGHFCE